MGTYLIEGASWLWALTADEYWLKDGRGVRGMDRCLHLRTHHVAVWIPQHLLDARPVRGPVSDDGLGTCSPDKRSHPVAQLWARTSDPLCEGLADREEIDWCVFGHEHLDALCVQVPATENFCVPHPLGV